MSERMSDGRLSVFEQNAYRLDGRCNELIKALKAERERVEKLERREWGLTTTEAMLALDVCEKENSQLKDTIKRVEKHKDSKILECQCLQEVVDKNLISIKAIRELPEKWRKYTFDNPEATSYIDSADCADELEALLPEEQTNEQ